MSRNIDLTKPLSAADREYLVQRGRFSEIERADAMANGEEDYASRSSESGVRLDPNTVVKGSGEMPLPPNTGDVSRNREEVLSANEPLDYDAGAYTISQLREMEDEDLDELLEARGLPRTGTQEQKITRLLGATGRNVQRDVSEEEGKLGLYDDGDADDEDERGVLEAPVTGAAGATETPIPSPLAANDGIASGEPEKAEPEQTGADKPEPDEDVQPDPYAGLDEHELRELAKSRGLSPKGKPETVLKRLREADEK